MNPSTLEFLACPRDGAFPLDLNAESVGVAGEVESGSLRCSHCGHQYAITDGIPDLVFLGNDLAESQIKQIEITARDQEAMGYYDGHFTSHQNAVEREAILDHLALERTSRVLDLGCGNGRISISILEQCGEFVGVDFSMTFLQALQAKVVGRSGTYLIRADVNHLPLRPEPVFDRIISTQVFEHLPSKQLRQHFLASSRTLLREEGRFVLTTYNFSRAKRKAGVPKEGFHPGSGIYYYCYDATELRKELAPYFHVAELHGIRNNFPRRVTEQLGKMGVLVDRLIERTRLSLTLGHLLLACCYPLSYNT